MTTKNSPLHLKCPCCDFNAFSPLQLNEHCRNEHTSNQLGKVLADVLFNIHKELRRLESLHLDFDRFATTQVAGQIQLLKSILGHEYYK